MKCRKCGYLMSSIVTTCEQCHETQPVSISMEESFQSKSQEIKSNDAIALLQEFVSYSESTGGVRCPIGWYGRVKGLLSPTLKGVKSDG